MGGRAVGSGRLDRRGNISNLTKVQNLPNYNGKTTDQVKTPFPYPNKDDANEIARYQFRIGQYSGLGDTPRSAIKEETVDLNKLSNSQDNVRRDSLEYFARNGVPNGELPYVVKYGNTYLIQDGHHRLTYLKTIGNKTARVRVFDLDAFNRRRR